MGNRPCRPQPFYGNENSKWKFMKQEFARMTPTTFTDKAGEHTEKAGNDCPLLTFKVTRRGRGGVPDTVKCVECGKEGEAVDNKLLNELPKKP
jgi:hypothetical protein